MRGRRWKQWTAAMLCLFLIMSVLSASLLASSHTRRHLSACGQKCKACVQIAEASAFAGRAVPLALAAAWAAPDLCSARAPCIASAPGSPETPVSLKTRLNH